eukprot:CAMPEP_0198225758 /NCGR_PEP_ID=MMETSP1445-20131203/102473_1 /TAXON_ID=36898 /ORGANISM="Pyramimonas sp., Strain CCMP2087" /LENGTH=449 /DNA_ID=CAMNT_0043905383 /DNA_START=115 /DNA_END=1460 /DNA_ORIENTATION=-
MPIALFSRAGSLGCDASWYASDLSAQNGGNRLLAERRGSGLCRPRVRFGATHTQGSLRRSHCAAARRDFPSRAAPLSKFEFVEPNICVRRTREQCRERPKRVVCVSAVNQEQLKPSQDTAVHRCELCKKTCVDERTLALHVFSRKHLIKVVPERSLLVAKAKQSDKESKIMMQELLDEATTKEREKFPQLWEEFQAMLERKRKRDALVQAYGERYPWEFQWFKESRDWGFFVWSPRQRVSFTKNLMDASRWANENPDDLRELVRRVNPRGRPPLLSVPTTPVVLQKKARPCKVPSGYPYSTPSFSPLIAARHKKIPMEGVSFVATSMALRTMGLARPQKKPTLFVQRYRHMLVLSWSGSFKADLMQPGYQLERALTGLAVDSPFLSLDGTYTIRTGTIGPHMLLCCGEVDAVDRDGNVVEIKSNGKASTTADGKVQLMLCGAGKKVSPL